MFEITVQVISPFLVLAFHHVTRMLLRAIYRTEDA